MEIVLNGIKKQRPNSATRLLFKITALLPDLNRMTYSVF